MSNCCLLQIIRYSFFGMKEAFGSAPSWLLWLRLVLLLQKRHLTIRSKFREEFYQYLFPSKVFRFIFVALIACRYSTFMLLYPTGISSEVGLIYTALPYMQV